MIRILLLSFALLFTTAAQAHEMVPAKPKLEPSHIEGLSKATMTMFNKRADVEYYELGVFTEDWEGIPFVSNYRVYKIPYLSAVTFDVYIRNEDRNRAVYICSRSKIQKEDLNRTAISSRICSKIQR